MDGMTAPAIPHTAIASGSGSAGRFGRADGLPLHPLHGFRQRRFSLRPARYGGYNRYVSAGIIEPIGNSRTGRTVRGMALARFWNGLSIRSKQLALFSVIICSMSLIGFTAYFTAYANLDRFSRNLSSYFEINGFLLRFADTTRGLERSLRENGREGYSRYAQSMRGIMSTLERIDAESNVNLETYFLLRAITNALSVYRERCDEAIRARLENREGYYLPYSEAERIGRYIEGYIEELLYISLREGNFRADRLMDRAKIVRSAGLAAILAVFVLSLVSALLFSARLTNPIRKLARLALRISEGDLNVGEIPVRSADEVGVLAGAFNRMSASIRRMVEDLKEKAHLEAKLHDEELAMARMERLLREAQFAGLQAQINPHFLFNTLNIISRTAMFEHADETAALIRSLASLFRYNLTSPNANIPLSEELEIIRQYMNIQGRRFADRIRFRLECEPEAESIGIPPFILQPLVENAVIHGLEPREEGGTLILSIRVRRRSVGIRVFDTGVGMTRAEVRRYFGEPPEEPERLSTDAAGPDSRGGADSKLPSGIGIGNVMRRLSISYNGRARLSVASRPGNGTLVTVRLPFEREPACQGVR